MMEDMLDDIPLFHDIQEKAFKEGMHQGEQRGEQRGKVDALRPAIISIIEQRFPALLKLAQQQAGLIDDPHALQSIVVLLALASTEEQACDALLSWLH